MRYGLVVAKHVTSSNRRHSVNFPASTSFSLFGGWVGGWDLRDNMDVRCEQNGHHVRLKAKNWGYTHNFPSHTHLTCTRCDPNSCAAYRMTSSISPQNPTSRPRDCTSSFNHFIVIAETFNFAPCRKELGSDHSVQELELSTKHRTSAHPSQLTTNVHTHLPVSSQQKEGQKMSTHDSLTVLATCIKSHN